ncbi:HNHc domain containing protein [uncultured Caudovirales phage]|uniref:HNHc domain containing protein n=1 Tax=uncultured Caudovirales phage TaxID=2100421 RepID=A0A6J5KX34_9CAUD|nr:HNHc domain containing protein [uncultured Caudovirales phage]
MKTCSKCEVKKELKEFYKDKAKIDKLCSSCKTCHKIITKKYYEENLPKISNINKNYYKKNTHKLNNKYKERYQENKEKAKLNAKLYYYKNKEQRNINGKIYRQNNKDICNAAAAKYRATKLNATPKWLTEQHVEQIEYIYKMSNTIQKLTNIKCHVDHIIPLQGKIVSGLHVPWNLRIITSTENLKKGNKLYDFI